MLNFEDLNLIVFENCNDYAIFTAIKPSLVIDFYNNYKAQPQNNPFDIKTFYVALTQSAIAMPSMLRPLTKIS